VRELPHRGKEPAVKTFLVLLSLIIALLVSVEVFAARAGSGRSSSGYRSYKGGKAIDGDTFRHQGERYRLRDYDAPEKGQKGSSTATRSLQKKLDSGYQYKVITKDAYGRSLVEERVP